MDTIYNYWVNKQRESQLLSFLESREIMLLKSSRVLIKNRESIPNSAKMGPIPQTEPCFSVNCDSEMQEKEFWQKWVALNLARHKI